MYGITREQFEAALRKAVEERGADYTYPFFNENFSDDAGLCRYVTRDGKEPACIIGVALHKCGMDLADLVKSEKVGAQVVMRNWTNLPPNVNHAARSAQLEQDKGRTWGVALAVYFETVGS